MSLLNQKQIQEIIDMATQQAEFAEILKLKLDHWNSNQHSFNVNWNDAPKYATKVALRLYWVTETSGSELWSASFDSVTFERPAPVITPHPHAEMMAKYAEVAARRIDPWVEFEIYNESFGNWVALEVPTFFDAHLEYRHIGDKP
jgi:hypothetical protein